MRLYLLKYNLQIADKNAILSDVSFSKQYHIEQAFQFASCGAPHEMNFKDTVEIRFTEYTMSPWRTATSPLDQTEKAVYKKWAYIILGILVLTALLAWFVGLSFVSVSIIAALFVLAVMLVLGKLKNLFGGD